MVGGTGQRLGSAAWPSYPFAAYLFFFKAHHIMDPTTFVHVFCVST
jgi:hypothetical protein